MWAKLKKWGAAFLKFLSGIFFLLPFFCFLGAAKIFRWLFPNVFTEKKQHFQKTFFYFMERLPLSIKSVIVRFFFTPDNYLLFSLSGRRLDHAKSALCHRASPYLKNNQSSQILIRAIKEGDKELIDFILEHLKININHQDDFGNTALHCSLQRGDSSLTERLLVYSPNLNATNQWQVTPLMAAVESGQIFLVQLIVKQGADLHRVDSFGDNALLSSIKYSYEHIALYLLEQGSSSLFLAPDGRSLSQWAEEKKMDKLMEAIGNKESLGENSQRRKTFLLNVKSSGLDQVNSSMAEKESGVFLRDLWKKASKCSFR